MSVYPSIVYVCRPWPWRFKSQESGNSGGVKKSLSGDGRKKSLLSVSSQQSGISLV